MSHKEKTTSTYSTSKNTTKQKSLVIPREPGKWKKFCILSASAAELFSQYVCMTSNSLDIVAQFIHPDEESIHKILEEEYTQGSSFRVLVSGTINQTDNKGYQSEVPITISITSSTVEMLNSKECRGKPYIALKLGSPGHVALALYDAHHNIIEIFDSSGSSSNTIWSAMIKQVFPNKINIVFVNDQFLQKEDKYCQTYIYWYVYQRVLVGEPRYRVVQELQRMSPGERFMLMNQFWNFLIYTII